MRAWYSDTGAVGEEAGKESCMARARSVNSDSMSASGEENIWLSAGTVASMCSRRSMARLTNALG